MYKLVNTIYGGAKYIVKDNSIKEGFRFYSEVIFTNADKDVLNDFRNKTYSKGGFLNYLYDNNFSFWASPRFEYVDSTEIENLVKDYKYYYDNSDKINGEYNLKCFNSKDVFNRNKSVIYIYHYVRKTPFKTEINRECFNVERIATNIGSHEIEEYPEKAFSVDLYKDDNGRLYLNYVPYNNAYDIKVEEIDATELEKRYSYKN